MSSKDKPDQVVYKSTNSAYDNAEFILEKVD